MTTTIPPYGIAACAPRCATRRVAAVHSAGVHSAAVRSATVRSAAVRSAAVRSAAVRSAAVRSATGHSAASLLMCGVAGTMTTTHSHDGADRASRDTAGLGPTQPSTRPVHHTPAEVAAP